LASRCSELFKEEGCLAAYDQGQSIDQWLVDPKDEQSKIKFLQKLAKKQNQEPNKEQLGDISLEAYEKAKGIASSQHERCRPE
jgi:hypothetical protein